MNTDTLISDSLSLNGWQIAWAQLTGCHHRVNEDRVAIRAIPPAITPHASPQGVFLALADGVGGGARGDVAAAALCQHALQLADGDYCQPQAIAHWMGQAENHVQAALRQVTFAPGAATLAAAWLGADGSGHLLRVGDARLYRLDEQGLTPLTADQTYAHTGETPPPGAQPEDCANMVGTGFMGEPDVHPVQLAPQQRLLLCSDGLHRGQTDAQLHAALQTPDAQSPQGLAASVAQLVQAAREAGSEDDISLLVARRLLPSRLVWWRRWLHLG